jgi:hypothetical protein
MRNKCCVEWKSLELDYTYCPECGMCLKPGTTEDKEATITHDGDRTIERHEAYGQLSFSRRSSSKGGERTLYGSSIQHQNTITLSVIRSEKQTDPFSERYFGTMLPIIEVEMSQSQFTEAITAMNIGDGVPVTIKSVQGVRMATCKELSIREQADKNLKERFSKVAQTLKEEFKMIKELSSKKGTLTATEKKDLLNGYSYFLQEVSSNLPFLKECIDEQVDKSVTSAKDEVEAFWMNRINSLGIAKLNELAQGYDPPKLVE